ncbi:hypothetical protein DFH08DRAFT_805246 [Mycena albidolilacea]|uniref:Uncharacterized protein n=1 Tax=Mycena albidolilacea TaxID=1033008 RepID=A0AAD7A880_9AGAR|nr:hypothetical protein DFH08DRAFT_805246 [Mycena albidolilacea]
MWYHFRLSSILWLFSDTNITLGQTAWTLKMEDYVNWCAANRPTVPHLGCMSHLGDPGGCNPMHNIFAPLNFTTALDSSLQRTKIVVQLGTGEAINITANLGCSATITDARPGHGIAIETHADTQIILAILLLMASRRYRLYKMAAYHKPELPGRDPKDHTFAKDLENINGEQ